jgi:hypothetical protein
MALEATQVMYSWGGSNIYVPEMMVGNRYFQKICDIFKVLFVECSNSMVALNKLSLPFGLTATINHWS